MWIGFEWVHAKEAAVRPDCARQCDDDDDDHHHHHDGAIDGKNDKDRESRHGRIELRAEGFLAGRLSANVQFSINLISGRSFV